MFDLDGKVALIAGSTRGIGLAIAKAFQKTGTQVVITSEDEVQTARTAAELNILGIAADVRDGGALAYLVEGSVAHFAGLDILVCNAGITGITGPFSSVDGRL